MGHLLHGHQLMYTRLFLAEKNYEDWRWLILQKIISILNKQYDTLLPLSFAFNLWQVYIKSSLRKLNKWGITYFHEGR